MYIIFGFCIQLLRYYVSFNCRKMRPVQRRRINDRFMRFDNEDRHQEKKLYSSSDSLYDGLDNKLVSLLVLFFRTHPVWMEKVLQLGQILRYPKIMFGVFGVVEHEFDGFEHGFCGSVTRCTLSAVRKFVKKILNVHIIYVY